MSKKRNQRNTKESLKNLSAKRKTYRGGGRAGGEPALPQSVAERRAKAAAARAKTAANKAPTKTKPKAPAPFDDSIAPKTKPKPKAAPKPKAPVPRSSITDRGANANPRVRTAPPRSILIKSHDEQFITKMLLVVLIFQSLLQLK